MSGPTASRIAINCSVTPRISRLSQFSSGQPERAPEPRRERDQLAVRDRQDVGFQRTEPALLHLLRMTRDVVVVAQFAARPSCAALRTR